jgi:hypothetical protein
LEHSELLELENRGDSKSLTVLGGHFQ